MRSYLEVNINSSGNFPVFDKPRCLFHYRSELEAHASMRQDQEARNHVAFCLRYIAKYLRREIFGYQNNMQDKEVIPGIEFQDLWMAFKCFTKKSKTSTSSVDLEHCTKENIMVFHPSEM